jgi:hypothetical protein
LQVNAAPQPEQAICREAEISSRFAMKMGRFVTSF